MPTTPDLVLWALTTLAELIAVYVFLVWGLAREFPVFTGYLGFSAVSNAVSFVIFERHGFTSQEYFECSYVAAVLEMILLYASVGELALRSARGVGLAKILAVFTVAGIAAAGNFGGLEMPWYFFFAASKNLFWLGGAVALGLSIWSFWRTAPGRPPAALRLAQVMAVFFLLHAIGYGLHVANITGGLWGAVASAWLPMGASLVAMRAP